MNPLLLQAYLDLISTPHNSQPNYVAMISAVLQPFLDAQSLLLALDTMFDVDFASGQQLDYTAQWVGTTRVVTLVFTLPFFGFQENGGGATGGNTNVTRFGELSDPTIGARFVELIELYAGSAKLQDGEFRSLVRAQISKNKSHGTYTDMLNALQLMFQTNLPALAAPVVTPVASGGSFAAAWYQFYYAVLDANLITLATSGSSIPAYIVANGEASIPFVTTVPSASRIRFWVSSAASADGPFTSLGYIDYLTPATSPAVLSGSGITAGTPVAQKTYFEVIDNENMTINVFIGRPLTPAENSLVNSLDALPRPAGVAINSLTHL